MASGIERAGVESQARLAGFPLDRDPVLFRSPATALSALLIRFPSPGETRNFRY
ncbi:MAG TPA: hypothetical protein VF767_08655 [Bryobacteraceae bacterium]